MKNKFFNDPVHVEPSTARFWASILLACLMFFVIFGCSPAKRMTNAVERVKTSDTAIRHIGLIWERTNPCVTESNIDTVLMPVFIEAELNRDSLRRAICPPFSDSGQPSTGGVITPGNGQSGPVIRVPCNCPPSREVIRTVEDVRRLNLARDSIRALQLRELQMEARLLGEIKVRETYERTMRDQQKDHVKKQVKTIVLMAIPFILLLLAFIFRNRIFR